MTVRLRGHHLLCMLTYVGRGYTPAFSANLDRIVRRLSEGEDILLVTGPDDICAPRAFECGAHCPSASVRLRDTQALADAGRTLGRALEAGMRLSLTAEMVAAMRVAFGDAGSGERGLRRACGGCEWATLCTGIAAGGYAEVKLRMLPRRDADKAAARTGASSGVSRPRSPRRPAAGTSAPVR